MRILPNTPMRRLVVGTLLVLVIGLCTASTPDATEVWTAAVWCFMWGGLEVYWASRKTRGEARRAAIALAAAAAILAWLLTPPKHETVTVNWHGPETLKDLKHKLLMESYR